jgi:Tannase and feruloyl esterase
MAECDKRDGLEDGIIDDPRKCRTDPMSLICKAGQTTGCLTSAQAETARRVYLGPVNSKGQAIRVGGAAPGSEMNWLGDYFQDGARPAAILPFTEHKFRYMTFAEDPGPGWTVKDIDWNKDPDRAAGLGSVYAATNPDLRRFKARGGKLIGYHGWADENVIPATRVGYYELATGTLGGKVAMDSFYRLFRAPGMNHCASGVGADKVDWLGALEAWVEKDQAPERLVGTHEEAGKAAFSRPYFPIRTWRVTTAVAIATTPLASGARRRDSGSAEPVWALERLAQILRDGGMGDCAFEHVEPGGEVGIVDHRLLVALIGQR